MATWLILLIAALIAAVIGVASLNRRKRTGP
jgi:hypothetical protein